MPFEKCPNYPQAVGRTFVVQPKQNNADMRLSRAEDVLVRLGRRIDGEYILIGKHTGRIAERCTDVFRL